MARHDVFVSIDVVKKSYNLFVSFLHES